MAEVDCIMSVRRAGNDLQDKVSPSKLSMVAKEDKLRRQLQDETTYRRSGVPQKTPIDLGKPFMLLDLAGTAPTSEASSFIFLQKLSDTIFACTRYQGDKSA
jgi:hypothetical protein